MLAVMLPTGTLEAPAKINVTLEILARRSDGYHGIRSVMLPLGLHDRIAWEPAPAFTLTSNLCVQGEDLIVRALRALGSLPPVRMTVEKNIPAGGGLGGGSSDAAAVILAALRGAFGPAPAVDVLAVARSLGSDVPFFLVGTGALVEGTGERVTALGALPSWWVVLTIPAAAVATAGAYDRLDAARQAEPAPVRPRSDSLSLAAASAVQRGDFAAAIALAHNDFEPLIAAREPAVAAALAALRTAGARKALLAGSGACCFALCEHEAEAHSIASRLPDSDARTLVVPLAGTPAWRPPAEAPH